MNFNANFLITKMGRNLGFSFFTSTENIRLSEKCLPFANVFFATAHIYKNVKPSVWKVAVFISTEQNGSYVIRQNNIK